MTEDTSNSQQQQQPEQTVTPTPVVTENTEQPARVYTGTQTVMEVRNNSSLDGITTKILPDTTQE